MRLTDAEHFNWEVKKNVVLSSLSIFLSLGMHLKKSFPFNASFRISIGWKNHVTSFQPIKILKGVVKEEVFVKCNPRPSRTVTWR